MKVWVVKNNYDHEGFLLAGIYSSEALAEARAAEEQKLEVCDSVTIELYIIDERVSFEV